MVLALATRCTRSRRRPAGCSSTGWCSLSASRRPPRCSTIAGDYPHETSRGRFVGTSFFLNGLGSVLFFVVLTRLPTIYADAGAGELWAGRYAYLTVAAIALEPRSSCSA